ncbi:MAG: hypothetical protein ACLR4A_09520 [Christensenellales bacterium]
MLAELVRQVKPVELIPVTEGEVRALFPVVGRDPIAEIKMKFPSPTPKRSWRSIIR